MKKRERLPLSFIDLLNQIELEEKRIIDLYLWREYADMKYKESLYTFWNAFCR